MNDSISPPPVNLEMTPRDDPSRFPVCTIQQYLSICTFQTRFVGVFRGRCELLTCFSREESRARIRANRSPHVAKLRRSGTRADRSFFPSSSLAGDFAAATKDSRDGRKKPFVVTVSSARVGGSAPHSPCRSSNKRPQVSQHFAFSRTLPPAFACASYSRGRRKNMRRRDERREERAEQGRGARATAGGGKGERVGEISQPFGGWRRGGGGRGEMVRAVTALYT